MEDEEIQNSEERTSKISLPEIVIGTMVALLFDAADILLVWLTLDFIVLDMVYFPLIQFYLFMKGVKGTYALAGNIIELFPYIGVLPARTALWLATCWIDHHPKLLAAVSGATKTKGIVDKLAA